MKVMRRETIVNSINKITGTEHEKATATRIIHKKGWLSKYCPVISNTSMILYSVQNETNLSLTLLLNAANHSLKVRLELDIFLSVQ